MNAADQADNWAAQLKAVNLAFAEREWQLTESLKTARERLSTVEQQVVDAEAALARLEGIEQARQEAERQQQVALDAHAALLETLSERERNHAEQTEGLLRRLADVEGQLAAVSAAGEQKAAENEALHIELLHAREAAASALRDSARQVALLAAAESDVTERQHALSQLSAEYERMKAVFRTTVDAYAGQIRDLQLEQARLKGLLVIRLSERVRGLLGRPPGSVAAPLLDIDSMRSAGLSSHTDPKPGPLEPASPAVNSERPVTHTPKASITHLHQLMALRGHAFIDAAYATLLNRRPDASGLEYYLNRLQTDQDKARILIELATSDEGRARGKSLAGLPELIAATDTRSHRLRRWLLKRPAQDQALARIESSIGALADDFDWRLQAMDQRLAQLSRTLDGAVNLLSARIEAVKSSVEVASSLMAGDADAVAKARLALFQSQSLVAQSLQTSGSPTNVVGAPIGVVTSTAAPTTDALACYLTAEGGSASLIDSLSRHLATTTQAKTLSTD